MKSHLLKILTLSVSIFSSFTRLAAMPVAGESEQAVASQAIAPMPIAASTPTTAPDVQPVATTATPMPIAAPDIQPVAATQSSIPPTAATPATPAATQAQLKEVEDALRDLEQTKQTLATLLTELDAKLLEARKQAAEAKTLSFSLLEKQQEQEAKDDFVKIRQANESIKETQKYVQETFTPNFNQKISDLRVKATQADAALKALDTAAAATTATQPTPPQPAVASPAQPLTSTPAKEPTPPTTVRKQESKGLLDSFTSGIASVIKGIKNIFGGDDTAKKKTVITKPSEQIPADASQRGREAVAMVQQMDQQLQSLDATRGTIQQYLTAINQGTQYIESIAKQTPEGTKLLAKSKKPLVVKKDPKWKSVVLSFTGKILDGIGQLGSNLYELFDATIGSFARNFVKDIKKKISSDAPTKTTPGAA